MAWHVYTDASVERVGTSGLISDIDVASGAKISALLGRRIDTGQ